MTHAARPRTAGSGPVPSSVELLQQLLRFNTSNPPGLEAECISFIDKLLREAGLETRLIESVSGRPNLVGRLQGRGVAPPLLLQGHVDVVPAPERDWRYPPFAGEIHDGQVWGRGALDMKSGVAMMLAAVLHCAAKATLPPGDVVVAMLVDEETGSEHGAAFLVERHRELFDGVRYAIGEFGGFSLAIGGGRRVYPIQVAEKQVCWMTATIRGHGGHGALARRGSTIARLGEILRRLETKRLPVRITPMARAMIEQIAAELPVGKRLLARRVLDPRLTDHLLSMADSAAERFEPLLRNTVSVTGIHTGEQSNVIPSEATLALDGRMVPGCQPDDLIAELRDLVGVDIDFSVTRYDRGPDSADLGLFRTLDAIIREQEGGGHAVPMLMPAASDGRFFARCGIQTYGFLPMCLPESLQFNRLIHAVDERIPVDAVTFGTRALSQVLQRFDDIDEGRIVALG